MGARKRLRAERLKAEKKSVAGAILRNCPSSPRKMRLVADLIRGVEVNKALGVLKYTKKHASIDLEKLLKSAIANWEAKNEGNKRDLEDGKVFVSEIFVDGGPMLKRISPAPQGRAYRIRKRSNHVHIVLDTYIVEEIEEEDTKTKKEEAATVVEAADVVETVTEQVS
ncbi:MAG: 50S ribosomal protein L22 [Prevotellaceae bacterium]|jgi:large subunit ribosomal protein L22|nr:50S ribosomal protein L22 [Prevotellaceae bacterium]